MANNFHIPTPLEGGPPNVIEQKVLSVNCPNPKCDEKLDITNINAGTKVSCPKCNNVTWVPAFKEQWWQKLPVFVGSVLVAIFVGVAAGIITNITWSMLQSTPSDVEEASD